MNPRILIVDDAMTNIAIARAALEADGGFSIETASNAKEAIEKIFGFHPDLVLMDIQMPELDGLALTAKLRANPATADVVIVAFTAYAMLGDEEKLLGGGCDGYLSKPIDVRMFSGQVRELLRTARGGLRAPR